MNRCGMYARFSSENQKESSIADQIRNCRNFAEKNGLIVSSELTFKDEAISGSISNGRRGYQALMKAVEKREVETILVDSLERLSRDQEELHRIYKRLKFRGVTLLGVSDGYNGSDKLAKVNLTVKGLVAEMFLDDLKEKTHRGLEGVFINRRSPGGAPYGYRSVPIYDETKADAYGRPALIGARKEIDPETAEIVRKIFHLCAEGYSSKQIAYRLNELGIPAPRNKNKGWSFSTIRGDRKKALGILNNPIYIGKPIWNRTEWLKSPITEKRVYRMRPGPDWVHVEIPELRIISDDLWNAVKERQEKNALRKPFSKKAHPKHILSGLLSCSACGCSYIVQRRGRYYCSGHLNRGNAICKISQHLSCEEVEIAVMKALSKKLLEKKLLNELTDKIESKFKQKLAQAPANANNMENELQKALRERDNILDAIKSGIFTPSTKQALLDAEAKIKTLEDRQKETASPPSRQTFMNIDERIKELVSDLRKVWKKKPVEARDKFHQIVERIVVERVEDKAMLRIQGSWEALVPLDETPVDPSGCGGRI